VQPLVLVEIEQRIDRPDFREQRGAGHGKDPIVEHLLGMQLRPVAGAVADRRVEVGLHEVDQLAARVEPQIDFRVLLVEVAEPRQQPLLQERAEQADVEQAAAAILPQLFDCTRELAHPALDSRQQPRALRRQAHRAAVSHEQRRLQKFFERFDVRADPPQS
jgi:hypothetical protein